MKKESCLISISMMKNLTYKKLSANIYEKKPNASNYANFYIYRLGQVLRLDSHSKPMKTPIYFGIHIFRNKFKYEVIAFVISEILSL